jgi:uncharacterized protein (TIGR03663 family)
MPAAEPSTDAVDVGPPVDRVVVAVVAVAVVALAARLIGLGARPFHWDEARVGYWSLRFLDSGTFVYRPVAGGPLLYVVERTAFGLFGTGDGTARAVVAVLGGGAPLAALLFRGRLDDGETVALAGLLAASPVLLYYGRFLRGDVPLAAFGLVVVGCGFRLLDAETGDADGAATARYRYLGAGALGLAVATSGLAVGYVICWLGAAALTLDQRRLVGEGRAVYRRLDAAVGRLTRAGRSAVGAAGVFVVVHGYFYAPRTGGTIRPTAATVEAAFLGAARRFYAVRVVGRRQGGTHQLLPYLQAHAEALAAASAVVLALAAAGFLADRYGRGPSRTVVAFHAYWAGLSAFVIPVIAEESAPWLTVHTVAPALVPAAAGVGLLGRYASRTYRREDAVGVAAALLVAAAVVGALAAGVAGTAYGPASAANPLVHDAQPGDDLDPFVADVTAAAGEGDGVDVLFYGPTFVPHDVENPDAPPVSDEWGNRLPLAWYVERAGLETDGVRDEAALAARDSLPPVVVADAKRRSALAPRLRGYEARTYRLSLWNRGVVVFVGS